MIPPAYHAGEVVWALALEEAHTRGVWCKCMIFGVERLVRHTSQGRRTMAASRLEPAKKFNEPTPKGGPARAPYIPIPTEGLNVKFPIPTQPCR